MRSFGERGVSGVFLMINTDSIRIVSSLACPYYSCWVCGFNCVFVLWLEVGCLIWLRLTPDLGDVGGDESALGDAGGGGN